MYTVTVSLVLKRFSARMPSDWAHRCLPSCVTRDTIHSVPSVGPLPDMLTFCPQRFPSVSPSSHSRKRRPLANKQTNKQTKEQCRTWTMGLGEQISNNLWVPSDGWLDWGRQRGWNSLFHALLVVPARLEVSHQWKIRWSGQMYVNSPKHHVETMGQCCR